MANSIAGAEDRCPCCGKNYVVSQPPTIVRDPELAAVLAELQRVRNGLDRIEECLIKPIPQPPIPDEYGGVSRFYRSWWRKR